MSPSGSPTSTAHRHSDSQLVAGISLDVESRLFAGGFKNLLSGVTTVAHHDAYHAAFDAPDFPVRVPRGLRTGPTRSASIGEARRAASHRTTPAEWPWIIHAGEGVDEAAEEFARLEALGCIRANSLLVHALGFDARRYRASSRPGAAVVWCPASNVYLFGRTLDPLALAIEGRLALGSDSRLSGARDLLDELRAARDAAPGCARDLELLVTHHAARLLRLADRGSICAGMLADLVVLPRRPLADVRRAELRMVMIGGRHALRRRRSCCRARARCGLRGGRVDGANKVLARRLVEPAWKHHAVARAGPVVARDSVEGGMSEPRRKVVLYNPRAVFYTMPLALLAVGSELDPAKYEVVIVDGRLDPDPEKTVSSAARGRGVPGCHGAHRRADRRRTGVSRAAKAAHPDVPVVWGGWHPSMFGRECLREPCVDITVQAQGEATFVDIVAAARGRPIARRLRGMHVQAARRHRPRESAARAAADSIGFVRMTTASSTSSATTSSRASASSTSSPRRAAISVARSVRIRSSTGASGSASSRDRWSASCTRCGSATVRRSELPGRNVLHQARTRPRDGAADRRSRHAVHLGGHHARRPGRAPARRCLEPVQASRACAGCWSAWSPAIPEMLKRIKKDVTLEEVFHTAEQDARARHRAASFRSSSDFPTRTDASVDATIAARRSCAP